MGLLAVSQGEAGFQIAGKEFFVLDGGKERLVDGLLVGSALRSRLLLLQVDVSPMERGCVCLWVPYLWLLSLLNKSLLALFLLALLFPSEVFRAGNLV